MNWASSVLVASLSTPPLLTKMLAEEKGERWQLEGLVAKSTKEEAGGG